MTLYTWVVNAIHSNLDDETKIRVYTSDFYIDPDDKLITKGTINDLYKECIIDDDLCDAIIHNWYAWSKDDIVINLNKNPYEDMEEMGD